MHTRPELTVIVALVSGAVDRLRTCLTALDAQRFPGLQVLVAEGPLLPRPDAVEVRPVGGNPGKAEVCDWASWQPGKGILVLRNPSESTRRFGLTPKDALELPGDAQDDMTLHAIYPRSRQLPAGALDPAQRIELILQPFELVVMELRNRHLRPGAGTE